MNRISRVIGVFIVIAAFPCIATAQKSSIYSWTDENGVKHYSDRAPAEVVENKEQIPESYETIPMDTAVKTLNNQPVDPDAPNPDSAADELSYADQQRLEIAETRKARKEEQAERQRICLQATDELARIEPSRRVFYTDKSGETTRMDDEERVQRVEQNKQLIAEYCD